MNDVVKVSIVLLVMIYAGLTIFSIQAVYKVSSIKAGPYDPTITQLTEVGKKCILLPGPKTVWAILTPNGFAFYCGLPSPKKSKKHLFTVEG